MWLYRAVSQIALLGLLGILAACGDSTGLTDDPELNDMAAFETLPTTQVVGEGAKAWVCKIGPEGTTADFTITVDGPGTLPLGTEFTLNAYPECVWDVNTFYVWVAESPRPDPLVNTTLTVEEVGATPGMELMLIDYAEYLTDTYAFAYPPTTSATITVNYDLGGRFKFVNEGTPPPGFEGCTPGYWKQPQHFDSWPSPYVPGMAFEDVFDDVFGSSTLLDALKFKGGGLQALGRHTVAALLNAA